MNEYKIRFRGREINAIGVFYPITETVKAKNPRLAIDELYKKYEHIMFIKVYQIKNDEPVLVFDYKDF